MNIQMLHIDECPNWEEAGVRLRSALDAVGKPDVAIETILLTTPEEAGRYAFAGSTTILIDGEDHSPSAPPPPTSPAASTTPATDWQARPQQNNSLRHSANDSKQATPEGAIPGPLFGFDPGMGSLPPERSKLDSSSATTDIRYAKSSHSPSE